MGDQDLDELDESEQDVRDRNGAANLSPNTSLERDLQLQEDKTLIIELDLQFVHQGHTIHSLMQSSLDMLTRRLSPQQQLSWERLYPGQQLSWDRLSPQQQLALVILFYPSSSESSSFNLSRELELIMTPPRRQQQQELALDPPMPGLGRAG